MIRIVLMDSHQLFRVSLKSLLGTFVNCKVVLDISSFKEIPKGFRNEHIHLVILDPNSLRNRSLDTVRGFFPNAKMMILMDTSDRDYVLDCMQLGISGFFSKQDCPTHLESAVQDIVLSKNFEEVRLGAVVRKILVSDVGYRQKKKVQFTDREVQILKLVCMEKTNAEISTMLGLSIRTVESHRRRMIDKTDCRSIIGVILNALELKSLNLKTSFKNTHQAS